MPQRPLEARGPVAATDAPRPQDPAIDGTTLRDATAADIEAIVALTNAAYKPRDGRIFPGDRTDAADVAGTINGDTSAFIVAEIDGTIAASVRLELALPDAHFGPLATSLDYQRRGLAPALIAECERRGREAGCTTMHIGVIREVGMQPYYETLGYQYASETAGHELPWGQNTTQPFTLVHMQKGL